jgi:hypothetical protein
MTSHGPPLAPPELSRIVAVERIGTRWQAHDVTATAEECAALAQRFGLVELPALAAALRLRRARAGRYVEIDGVLRARVVQSCVVTLDPVAAALDEPFALLLGPIGGRVSDQAAPDQATSDLIVDLDEPEPLDGDDIDIGELVAQQLSLTLDPYPRAPEAADPEGLATAADGPETTGLAADSPFAVLRARRKPQ